MLEPDVNHLPLENDQTKIALERNVIFSPPPLSLPLFAFKSKPVNALFNFRH